jgi:hypothetical protein
MATIPCYLVSGSRVSFVRSFNSITLLFSDTPISDVLSENRGVMLPK